MTKLTMFKYDNPKAPPSTTNDRIVVYNQSLDRQERSAMEKEYAAACKRLSGDWRALERGWTLRRRALRCRQRELSARAHSHAAAARSASDEVSECELSEALHETLSSARLYTRH